MTEDCDRRTSSRGNWGDLNLPGAVCVDFPCLGRSGLHGLMQTGSQVTEDRPGTDLERSRAGWSFWDAPPLLCGVCCGDTKTDKNH